MANIPTNTSYSSAPTPTISKGFKYTPSTTYKNLATLKASGSSPFTPSATPVEGTEEYYQAKQAAISQYGNLVNNGMGIPTATPFLSPQGDVNASIPIPSDYGTFMEPMSFSNDEGEKLSWGTPTSPVIKNFNAGDVPSQYVQDTSNPNLLVKTNRGSNSIADNAIRDGRPSFMYQIDHIMPLELGGADTLANRQLLTADQNDQKTRAQAVPYTLYAHGDISLSEARAMAMLWKDRDVTDLPQPNSIGLVSDTRGKTGIEIAREVSQKWTEPSKMTLKGFMAEIPQTVKDLGKGFIPDPLREFIKGFGSGATLGFLPYQQGEDEGIDSKIAGIAGMAIGGVASFMLGGMLIDGALAAGGAARGAITAYRGVAAAKAAATGFGVAEDVVAGARAVETAGEIANIARTTGTTFKTLNRAPGYLKNILTPETIQRAGKLAATSAIVGQGSQFVENKMNPYTLGGLSPEKDAGVKNTIGRIFGDLAVGSLAGVGSPTIKGTAYATMLPLTLSFIANPDDPTTAITNGVIFGSMHAMGTAKQPGYMNIESLGGKPYINPVTKAFEATVNKASYESLRYYAPDVLPELKVGQEVPTAAHLAETVQQAKDTAIQNIWTRFFFGKEATPEVKTKTLSDLKNFSEKLNQKIDTTKTPELSLLDKFSLGKRKANYAETKAQNANITQEYGKGYQTRNTIASDVTIPEGGMDLQTALTEVKRVTAASRQLYKGGLVGELRNRADVDDLLSFGKSKLQGRFDAQEKYLNPPIVKQAVDSIDDSFMKRSFNNDNTPGIEGKYPNGDMAVTGAALTMNRDAAEYFFTQKAAGNASPNILLVDRSDTAPLWRMRNSLIDSKDIKLKNYAKDPNPENALQAFGVIKNPQTGQKELVPLGWLASDFRLNEATGKGHTAFNQHPAVLKYKETNGAEGLKPLSLHKDDIVPTMRKEGISVLVANLDPRATLSTVENKQPFVPVNLNDQNWTYSKALGDRLSQQSNKNPISMAISEVANAMGSKQKATAISKMKQQITQPASSYIPVTDPKVSPSNDKVSIPQETTRTVLQTMEKSLDVADPSRVKAAFRDNFGIILQDSQASEIFSRRNELTMRDGVKILVDAVNSGEASAATKVKLNFVKTYLESGILQSSDVGKAIPDMPLLGKMKNTTRATGQTEDMITPTTRTTIAPKPIETEASVSTSANPIEPTNLANKMVNANREFITNNKRSTVQDKTGTPLVDIKQATQLANNYIPELKSAIEDAKFGGRGYSLPDYDAVISGIAKRAATDMQSKNIPAKTIQEAVDQIRTAGEGHAETIAGEEVNTQFIPKEPIERPKFIAREFYNSIDDGIANKDNPGAHYFSKALDAGLKSILGNNYRNDKALPKVLADYFNNVFFNEQNASGREIQQHKDIVNARGAGDWNAEKAAYTARKKQLFENPTGENGGLSATEFANRGLNAEDMETGMNVRPWYQDDSMVHDLTKGEDMMSALFSDTPKGAATSVRAVKKMFLDKENGLLSFLLKNDPNAKRGSIQFDKLEKEAVNFDAVNSIEKNAQKILMEEAKQSLPELKKQMENLVKAMANPEERSNWQTPEILKENINDIKAKLDKYSKILGETKKEGAGGPGVNDGKGGIGSFFGGLWDKLKNGNTYTFTPEPASPTYDFRGVKANDSDINEISKILLGEVSNRDPEKQAFEVNIALNTGINRALSNPKKYEGSLTKVFQEPGQYQAYAPSGTYNSAGKVVENDYQRAVNNTMDYPTQQKLKVIQDALNKWKSGGMEDTTGGQQFYAHASDGTIWLGATSEQAIQRATLHEQQNKLQKTQFHGQTGFPATIVQK